MSRRGLALTLAGCVALMAFFQLGCRPPVSGLGGIDLLMVPEEVEQALGAPEFYLGDSEFRWSWYKGGILVGFARASAGELQAVWVLQTEGSLGGKLAIGASQADAERLYGRVSVIDDLSEPRIRLKTKPEGTLDIVLKGGSVSAFLLFLPNGRDPDIRLAGTRPGELPTFQISHPDSIDIYPTVPGTTWVYEEDMTGNSNYALTYTTIRETSMDGDGLTVTECREAPGWEEQTETQVTIVGHLRFYAGSPSWPTRLYIGLEWSSGVVHRNVVVAVRLGLELIDFTPDST